MSSTENNGAGLAIGNLRNGSSILPSNRKVIKKCRRRLPQLTPTPGTNQLLELAGVGLN